jgi:Mg-chelatase subunit ChlD
MTRIYSSVVCIGFFVLSAALFGAQAPVAPRAASLNLVSAQLIRCGPKQELPSIRFDLSVLDKNGQIVPLFRGIDKEAVRVIQTHPTLREYKPFYVSGDQATARSQTTERYVLILFDVSGSMNDPVVAGGRRKFEIAQEALSTVLEQFHNPTDHIAIAPFESHNVISGIRNIRFVSDAASANAQLRQLPPPSPTGNTALYPAVITGLDVLEAQNPGPSKLLIVFTDGKNDIRLGDDAELLKPDYTLPRVTDRARRAQISIFTIGLGSSGSAAIDETAMKQIAYPAAANYIPATDSETLRAAFRMITEQFFSRIRVTTKIDEASFQELTGADLSFHVRFTDSNQGSLASPDWRWSSPVSGFPESKLVCDRDENEGLKQTSPAVPGRIGPSRPFVQISTLVFYAALILFLWLILPRWLWPNAYVNGGFPQDFDSAPRTQPSPQARHTGHIQDPSQQKESELDPLNYSRMRPDQNAGFVQPEQPKRPERPTDIFQPTPTSATAQQPSSLTSLFRGQQTEPGTIPQQPNNPPKSSGLTDIFGKPTSTQFSSAAPAPSPETPKPPANPVPSGSSIEPKWSGRQSSISNDAPRVQVPDPSSVSPDRGPGEYTRIVSRGHRRTLTNTGSGPTGLPASEPNSASEPAAQRQAVAPTSNFRFVVLLIVNVVTLLGAAIVLYFLLKK